MKPSVAIIGDNFMLPRFFQEALEQACPQQLSFKTLQQAWPDVPMEHGYAQAGMAGLKEYLGDPDEIIEFIGDSPILVTHLAPLSAAMLQRMPQLKLVGVSRGGPVNIDMQAARQYGVTVVNAPGRNASAVAEFTIGAILAETRNITRGHDALRQGNWRGDLYRADQTGNELCDLTVGLIGYGAIGTRVTKLLRPFACRILVCDPYVTLQPEDAAAGVQQVDLHTLLAQSDVVSLHARVTAETTGFINADAFACMKAGSYFINTARGPMVDYEALYAALKSGHLRGTMLETFSIEPTPPDYPLLYLPNVTLTPHIAGASLRTVRNAAEQIAQEVRRYLAGEPLQNLC